MTVHRGKGRVEHKSEAVDLQPHDGQELWVKNKVVDAAEVSNSGWPLLYWSGAQWRASVSDTASRGASASV